MPAHILIAEDDRTQADILRRFLDRDGYDTVVVHDGTAALAEAARALPDLVVLDLMLPGVSGLDVCRRLRAVADVPIIMVTARTTEDDVLLGLALGADDYVTKPYSPREVAARVGTVLRRAARLRTDAAEQYKVGDLLVDVTRHEVRVAGRPVRTTLAEFNLLACLAAAPGRAFTRPQLLARVSGLSREATERTIDMHVMNLRRKIETVPTRPTYVLTVYGIGYKLADRYDTDEAEDA